MNDMAPDGHRQHPGMPTWVKMLALAAVVAVVVIIALMLLAGGDHGPGRHM